MKLSDLLKNDVVNCPWPTLVNSHKCGSSKIGISDTCRKKCGDDLKCSNNSAPGEHECVHGMSYMTTQAGNEVLTIYGVRGQKNTTPLNRYNREGLKGRYATFAEFTHWKDSLESLSQVVETEFLKRQSEMLDPLHDPMRLAKQISTISSKLVQSQVSGGSFEHKVEHAPIELKTLVKAAGLLSDSFELLTIYFNPDAASFGERQSISIHGLLTKLVAIFRVIDETHDSRDGMKIYFNGECFRNVVVFESFKLIPFAFLNNAVKYCMDGNIKVGIEDLRPSIRVTVESVGPFIEKDERDLIFQKRGRGKWAAKHSDGKGVGLYLAKIIADAHGATLSVSSNKTGKLKNDIPLAANAFSFEIDPSK